VAIAFHAHFDAQNQSIHFLENFAILGGLLHIIALGGLAFDALKGRLFR
jgi:uncharacterized membrane protein YphA (DoxX/SURF4 family)